MKLARSDAEHAAVRNKELAALDTAALLDRRRELIDEASTLYGKLAKSTRSQIPGIREEVQRIGVYLRECEHSTVASGLDRTRRRVSADPSLHSVQRSSFRPASPDCLAHGTQCDTIVPEREGARKVECPVCGREIPMERINDHLDRNCLATPRNAARAGNAAARVKGGGVREQRALGNGTGPSTLQTEALTAVSKDAKDAARSSASAASAGMPLAVTKSRKRTASVPRGSPFLHCTECGRAVVTSRYEKHLLDCTARAAAAEAEQVASMMHESGNASSLGERESCGSRAAEHAPREQANAACGHEKGAVARRRSPSEMEKPRESTDSPRDSESSTQLPSDFEDNAAGRAEESAEETQPATAADVPPGPPVAAVAPADVDAPSQSTGEVSPAAESNPRCSQSVHPFFNMKPEDRMRKETLVVDRSPDGKLACVWVRSDKLAADPRACPLANEPLPGFSAASGAALGADVPIAAKQPTTEPSTTERCIDRACVEQTVRVKTKSPQQLRVRIRYEHSQATVSPPLPPPGAKAFHLSPAITKSLLQKNVRLCQPESAVRSAAYLMHAHGVVELARRLAIIVLEDALLHPALPLVVAIMAAPPKTPHPPADVARILLQVTRDIAAVPVRDSLQFRDDESESAAPTSDDCDTLPPAEEALIRSILVRAAYGGMTGDMKMLRRFATRWMQRFRGDPVAGPLPTSANGNALALAALPWLHSPSSLSLWRSALSRTATGEEESPRASPWLQFITQTYADVYVAVEVEKVQVLQPCDIMLSAVDFHCSPLVDQLLASQSPVKNFIADFVDANCRDESARDVLARAIWNFRSSVSRKRICAGNPVDAERDAARAQLRALWQGIARCTNDLSAAFIQQRYY